MAKAARSRTTTRRKAQAEPSQPQLAPKADKETAQPEIALAETAPAEVIDIPAEAPTAPEAAPVVQQEDKAGTYPTEALYFDANWYLAAYPDVGACGIDAVEHFMTHGYLEGRDPNGHFSVAEYIAANPDIPLTINPFLHFIMHGAAEGRPLRR